MHTLILLPLLQLPCLLPPETNPELQEKSCCHLLRLLVIIGAGQCLMPPILPPCQFYHDFPVLCMLLSSRTVPPTPVSISNKRTRDLVIESNKSPSRYCLIQINSSNLAHFSHRLKRAKISVPIVELPTKKGIARRDSATKKQYGQLTCSRMHPLTSIIQTSRYL